MKWSHALIPTLREDPKSAEVKSHKILIRGGYIRPLASGIYNLLPMGWRIISKISRIIREEMDLIGAQEVYLPAISPKEIWEKTGRWKDYGDLMFRLKDRKGREFALSPTHEEVVTQIAAKELRSYRQLPQIWYQIQRKYRDELRPKGGMVRVREFLMKDSYSFDIDDGGLDESFGRHREAYKRIFERCRIDYYLTEASGGIMGKGASEEFLAPSESGEDYAVICDCGYQANLEVAQSQPQYTEFNDEDLKTVHTPGKKTVDEVSGFLEVSPKQLVKTMVYIICGKTVILLIRGDRELNEEKLRVRFGMDVRPATSDEIIKAAGAPVGFVGPVGLDVPIYADEELKGSVGMVTGANKVDYHVRGLDLNRDVSIKGFVDLRKVEEGDGCPRCGRGLQKVQVMELAHIFKLGTKYSGPLGATYVDAQGKEKPILMGSYGIGLGRMMACLCEQTSDEAGPNWPLPLAPFHASIVTINVEDKGQIDLSERLYSQCLKYGIEVIWDERSEGAGVKFKDHDLVGIPIRVTVGPEGMKTGKVDIKIRPQDKRLDVAADEVITTIREIKNDLDRT